jgi:1-deoxy-D-xylulose-5-phosphate reductoisomerase
VEAFLAEQIRFMDIPVLIEDVLSSAPITSAESIEQLVAVDAEARLKARQWLSHQKIAIAC